MTVSSPLSARDVFRFGRYQLAARLLLSASYLDVVAAGRRYAVAQDFHAANAINQLRHDPLLEPSRQRDALTELGGAAQTQDAHLLSHREMRILSLCYGSFIGNMGGATYMANL